MNKAVHVLCGTLNALCMLPALSVWFVLCLASHTGSMRKQPGGFTWQCGLAPVPVSVTRSPYTLYLPLQRRLAVVGLGIHVWQAQVKKHYFAAYFDCITASKGLCLQSSVKGGAHTRYVEALMCEVCST